MRDGKARTRRQASHKDQRHPHGGEGQRAPASAGRGQPRPLTRAQAHSPASLLALPVRGCDESLNP